jgi:hypothetical protein
MPSEFLCRQQRADSYDRLCYVAGDYSERMLRDAGQETANSAPGDQGEPVVRP